MTTTSPMIYYVIGAVILVVVVIVVAIVATRRARSVRLQRRFGPEYRRVSHQSGDRAQTEHELAKREERVKKFHLEELPVGARDRYVEEWRTVQARFVDQPRDAITQADALIVNVMRDRGYPVADFEQRASDLSPDYATVVQDYRTAHDISVRNRSGEADTEDLRQAMVHYRSLFSELVGADERTK